MKSGIASTDTCGPSSQALVNSQRHYSCAHVHAADVRQEADLALGVAARQGDGNDVALLALKRIDGAHAEPALQQLVMQPSKAPCAPRHALPRRWQNVGLFARMVCPCHFQCVPPRFGYAINQPSKAPPDPKSTWQPLSQKSLHLPSTQGSLSPWRKPERASHPHLVSQFFRVPAF